jgi:hypothetical protein
MLQTVTYGLQQGQMTMPSWPSLSPQTRRFSACLGVCLSGGGVTAPFPTYCSLSPLFHQFGDCASPQWDASEPTGPHIWSLWHCTTSLVVYPRCLGGPPASDTHTVSWWWSYGLQEKVSRNSDLSRLAKSRLDLVYLMLPMQPPKAL